MKKLVIVCLRKTSYYATWLESTGLWLKPGTPYVFSPYSINILRPARAKEYEHALSNKIVSITECDDSEVNDVIAKILKKKEGKPAKKESKQANTTKAEDKKPPIEQKDARGIISESDDQIVSEEQAESKAPQKPEKVEPEEAEGQAELARQEEKAIAREEYRKRKQALLDKKKKEKEARRIKEEAQKAVEDARDNTVAFPVVEKPEGNARVEEMEKTMNTLITEHPEPEQNTRPKDKAASMDANNKIVAKDPSQNKEEENNEPEPILGGKSIIREKLRLPARVVSVAAKSIRIQYRNGVIETIRGTDGYTLARKFKVKEDLPADTMVLKKLPG